MLMYDIIYIGQVNIHFYLKEAFYNEKAQKEDQACTPEGNDFRKEGKGKVFTL